MRMLLVGSGAVGESILRILEARDPKKTWLEHVVVADFNLEKAKTVCGHLNHKDRYTPEFVDAHKKEDLVQLIKTYNCDFVMDAAAPFVTNRIFDAAFEAGAKYANMGTWSVPFDPPHSIFWTQLLRWKKSMPSFCCCRADNSALLMLPAWCSGKSPPLRIDPSGSTCK